MTKKLIFIDPNYGVDFGHYTRMGKLLRDEAKNSGIEMEHFVNLDVPQHKADELGLIRRFEYLAGLPWLEDPDAALNDFYTSLDEILSSLARQGGEQGHVLFMYTAHPLHLPVLALLSNKYHQRIKGLSVYACLFYLNQDFCLHEAYPDEYLYMLTGVSFLVEMCDHGKLLNICTDSERTKDIYGVCFDRDLRVLPLPIENITPLKKPAHKVSGKITLGYIGQTTKRAGYDIVYELYKRFVETGNIDNVHFKIKLTQREKLKDLHDKFKLESINITHVEGFLGKEAYEQFFSDCDVILIPYSRRFYPSQTSGIVTEALCMEKIIVVPENTWMSDQIMDYGSGETFISDDLESLAEVVKKIIDNFEYYCERRARNIEKYRHLHSSSNLLKELAVIDSENPDKGEEMPRPPLDSEASFESLARKQISLLVALEKSGEKIKNREIKIKNRDDQLQAMVASPSWKITRPLRRLVNLFNRNN